MYLLTEWEGRTGKYLAQEHNLLGTNRPEGWVRKNHGYETTGNHGVRMKRSGPT